MKLKEMHIKGYKSIDGQHGQTIPLGDLTILLGANGSGKSNLVSFFSEHLQEWLGRYSLSELWEKNVLGGQP